MLDRASTPDVSPQSLRRPQTSATGGGVVSCLGCGAVIPLASASILGVGYRCQSCSGRVSLAKASGSFAIVKPAKAPQRRQISKPGTELLLIGATVFALAAIVTVLGMWRIGIAAAVIASVTMAVGFARNKAAY